MQIQILSDLHLEIERQGSAPGREFYHYEIPVRAEHLALLGDIGWTIDDRLFEWLRVQLKLFKTVYFVSGNHGASDTRARCQSLNVSQNHIDHQSSVSSYLTTRWVVGSLTCTCMNTQNESASKLGAFATDVNSDPTLGSFIYLNRTRHDVSPKLTILGCTLWSALNPADLDILSWSLTDFRRISSFDPETFVALHRADLEWLNSTVSAIANEEPERDIVVFTHHSPTLDGTGDPKFNDQPTNSAFATELAGETCWTSGKVSLWAFGHTHWCCDFERDGVRVYSNQRGYGEGRGGYSADKVIKL
ncbi:hypothetical protein A0H81_06951 [Grifola frondosa]|uniref:Uncharacterized protein n=1 Tax=Grifola frondosa TaxID=5627 RepID=A0A1C7M8H0_GRIFR|nr:hypothetical protein A0H81_06951 [Grifola frondosa]